MQIQDIQFANEEKDSLRVTTTDGKNLSVPWPCRTWHNEVIQEWLDQGNSIAEIPGPTIDELRSDKKDELSEAFTVEVSQGVEYTFPDGTLDTIQTRPQDQTNLTALSVRATQLKQDGDTTTTIPFRALSNKTYELNSAEMIDMTNVALDHISSLYGKLWTLKDQTDAATESELETITW